MLSSRHKKNIFGLSSIPILSEALKSAHNKSDGTATTTDNNKNIQGELSKNTLVCIKVQC